MMYILTQEKDNLDSGAYATVDSDGTVVLQFFVDKDDAMTYNTLLDAVGYNLTVTETPDDNIDKICDMLGYAYTIAEPGEVLYPKLETVADLLPK